MLADQRQHRENYALPPRSRSPMKTFLSGSPRRTPILHSSPNARNRDVSSPIASRMAANKPYESQRKTASQSQSNLRHSHAQSTESQSDSELENLPHQQHVADFSDSDDDNDVDTGPNLTEADQANEESLYVQDHDGYEPHEEMENDDNNQGIGDGAVSSQEEEDGDDDDENANRDGVSDHEHAPSFAKRPGAEKNPRTKAPPKSRKPRSTTKKAAANQINHDEPEPENTHRSKRQKPSARTQAPGETADLPHGFTEVVEDITNRSGRNKSRSLYILKREEPRDSAQRTRSGRVSVRPLAYWRNERCVYGEGGAEIGQRFPLSTIKEVIRTEEPEPEKPQKPGKRKRTKGRSSRRHDPDESSDDDTNGHMDPWETEGGGVFYGPVKQWDNDEQKPLAEEEVMGMFLLVSLYIIIRANLFREDLAYAPVAVQTHPVKDASFSFAKILSTPFLGSGFVDMPAGSSKRTKNSKKMHMVFYMIHGRIQIEIAGLQFSAGKGTVFQVPRGKYHIDTAMNALD